MEIERINENTVKFYLSYVDIEERGFTREEVWYNREKSEELFWDMMEEINDESDLDFEVEGPLWIQVHAMSGGIEVTVTRAHLPSDGDSSEFPFGIDDPKKLFQQDTDIFEKDDTMIGEISIDKDSNPTIESLFRFKEFDHLIPLAKRLQHLNSETSLYVYENSYYLHIAFDDVVEDDEKLNVQSIISEYGTPSKMTTHRIQEYGEVIMESNVFTQIHHYF